MSHVSIAYIQVLGRLLNAKLSAASVKIVQSLQAVNYSKNNKLVYVMFVI